MHRVMVGRRRYLVDGHLLSLRLILSFGRHFVRFFVWISNHWLWATGCRGWGRNGCVGVAGGKVAYFEVEAQSENDGFGGVGWSGNCEWRKARARNKRQAQASVPADAQGVKVSSWISSRTSDSTPLAQFRPSAFQHYVAWTLRQRVRRITA